MPNSIAIQVTDEDFLVVAEVLELQEKYRNYWRDQPESYWLDRLHQEVSELHLSLDGQHNDLPELELKEIASICINWLLLRKARQL